MKTTIKNLIGGTLLVIAVLINIEFDLGWLLVLTCIPGWIFLLSWND